MVQDHSRPTGESPAEPTAGGPEEFTLDDDDEFKDASSSSGFDDRGTPLPTTPGYFQSPFALSSKPHRRRRSSELPPPMPTLEEPEECQFMDITTSPEKADFDKKDAYYKWFADDKNTSPASAASPGGNAFSWLAENSEDEGAACTKLAAGSLFGTGSYGPVRNILSDRTNRA